MIFNTMQRCVKCKKPNHVRVYLGHDFHNINIECRNEDCGFTILTTSFDPGDIVFSKQLTLKTYADLLEEMEAFCC